MPFEGADRPGRRGSRTLYGFAVLIAFVATGRVSVADAPRSGRLLPPTALAPTEYAVHSFPPPDTTGPPLPVQGLPVYPAYPPPADEPVSGLPQSRPPCDPGRCGPFDVLTGGGARYSGFPVGQLWDPPLAAKRQPRNQVLFSSLENDWTNNTVDTSIGLTTGFVRYEPADRRFAVQLDGFAVVASRFSQYDYLVASDYRAGVPVTFACGPWHGKFGYEHTSSHLGDDVMVRTGRRPVDYVRDELVGGIGRRFLDDRVRAYGQAAWSFSQLVPGDPPPFRFDLGLEGFWRFATKCLGAPFAAVNVEFDGAVNYSPAWTLQVGWHWRDPTRRLAQARVFGEYYSGRSPFGQFFQTREEFFGFGISLDY